MVQNVGLSRKDKRMLEFVPFDDNSDPAALLYVQANKFYLVFRKAFGNGHDTISGRNIPKFDCLEPCIVNYQFAIELMLKSLIALKGVPPEKTHNLIKLLTIAKSHYPQLSAIYDTPYLNLLLQEISKIGIRYAEGTTFLRHNIDQEKKPLQELSEAMEYIFMTLKQTFENAK